MCYFQPEDDYFSNRNMALPGNLNRYFNILLRQLETIDKLLDCWLDLFIERKNRILHQKRGRGAANPSVTY